MREEDDYDPESHTDDSIEDEWDVLTRCWEQLRHVCLAVSRGDETEADEMMGEIVDRMPAIYDNWDPTIGVPLRAYVFRTVRLYLRKRVARCARTHVLSLDDGDLVNLAGACQGRTLAEREASDAASETAYIVAALRAQDETLADLLWARFGQSRSYADIANEYRWSRVKARRMCEQAMLAAEMIAARRVAARGGDE